MSTSPRAGLSRSISSIFNGSLTAYMTAAWAFTSFLLALVPGSVVTNAAELFDRQAGCPDAVHAAVARRERQCEQAKLTQQVKHVLRIFALGIGLLGAHGDLLACHASHEFCAWRCSSARQSIMRATSRLSAAPGIWPTGRTRALPWTDHRRSATKTKCHQRSVGPSRYLMRFVLARYSAASFAFPNAGMTSRANQRSCSLNSAGDNPSAQWIMKSSSPGYLASIDLIPSMTSPGGPQNQAFCFTPSRIDGIVDGAPGVPHVRPWSSA